MRPEIALEGETYFALPIRVPGTDHEISAEELVRRAAADLGGIDRVRGFASFADLVCDNLAPPKKRARRWERRNGMRLWRQIKAWSDALAARLGYPHRLGEF